MGCTIAYQIINLIVTLEPDRSAGTKSTIVVKKKEKAMFSGELKKSTFAIVCILLVVGIVLIGVWYIQKPDQAFTGQVESVTIGQSSPQSSSLILIAEDQNYFADNGLNVTIKNYDAGLYAVNALIAGEVDIATATELVLAEKTLSGEKLQAVACIDKIDNEYIIARKDHGIQKVSDLAGKKIGVSRGTSAEFFLGRFLQLNGIDEQDITKVDLKPDQLYDAIVNGDVDAVITWEPRVFLIENELGDNGLVMPAQSGQRYYWLLITSDDFIEDHREAIERLIRAIDEAGQFVIYHPEEAKAIIKNTLGYDEEFNERMWSQNQFALLFDQSLIIAMEDETRWLMSNNLTDATEMPNYLDVLHYEIIQEVKPGAVNIMR